jgi:L-asparagine transporter-like permease
LALAASRECEVIAMVSSPQVLPSVELSRTLRGRHLTMISIGGIVGAGLFVGSSTSIRTGGPATFIGFAITGLVILMVMRMLAEMAEALPAVRSFTEFARAGLGAGAGFVAGWLYWYVWVMTVPVEAIAGAKILKTWIPLTQLQLGLALMALMTGVNLLSARSYAEFEFWFASIKVAAIIVFITLAGAYVCGWTAPHGNTLANLTDHGGFAPHGWIAVLAVVPTAFFSMTGAEITTIAAAESAQSGRAVARLGTTVIWRIMIFYVVSLFLIVAVNPWTAVRSGESPFTLALKTMGIPGADTLMSAIILTAVLSSMNSAFYVSSRVLFILAQHADAPQTLVRLNARRVPSGSVLIASAAGFIGIVAATEASSSVIFDFLVSASGALMIFVYLMIVTAQITLRRRREGAGEAAPTVRMWLFPWSSYAAILAMVGVLIAMASTRSLQRDLNVSCLTLALTAAAYFIVKRLRKDSLSHGIPLDERAY